MNWLGHSVIAIVLAIIVICGYVYYEQPVLDINFFSNSFIFIAVVFISSLVPDLDCPSSLFFKIVELMVLGAMSFFAVSNFGWTYEAFLVTLGSFVLFKLVAGIFIPSHRGIIHSLLFMLICGGAIWYFTANIVYVAGFIFGFWIHLIMDGCIMKLI